MKSADELDVQRKRRSAAAKRWSMKSADELDAQRKWRASERGEQKRCESAEEKETVGKWARIFPKMTECKESEFPSARQTCVSKGHRRIFYECVHEL